MLCNLLTLLHEIKMENFCLQEFNSQRASRAAAEVGDICISQNCILLAWFQKTVSQFWRMNGAH